MTASVELGRRFSTCALVLLGLFVLLAPLCFAHELKPAFLRIDATSDTEYAVVWKRPFGAAGPLSLRPVLPAGCAVQPGGVDFLQGNSLVRRDVVHCAEGMDGKAVGIEGGAVAMADVMVQVTLPDGRQINGVIGRNRPELSLSGGGAPVADYLVIGVNHLLLGADHLLFVLCLLYLLGTDRLGPLVRTVTAFTVAHSITLALSALNVVALPVAPVEATVALSIAFVAAEKLRGSEGTIAGEHVWVVAFLFGLLHGFGFAGALAEIGLPPGQAALSLFLFNVGVELGQVAVVVAVVGLVRLAEGRVELPAWLVRAPLYVAGGLSAFWFIVRTGDIFLAA